MRASRELRFREWFDAPGVLDKEARLTLPGLEMLLSRMKIIHPGYGNQVGEWSLAGAPNRTSTRTHLRSKLTRNVVGERRWLEEEEKMREEKRRRR